MSQDRGDRGPGAAYKGYTAYDRHYEKVGRVDDLFVDENDQPEYIGVKMGLLGSKSTLIPVELVRVNDRRHLVEIAADEQTIKHAPTFHDDKDITPEYEHGVYGYFGLQPPDAGRQRSSYGDYYDPDPSHDEELRGSVDTEFGERAGAQGPNLDIPVEDPGPARPADQEPYRETAPSGTTPSAGNPFDADAATRTGGDTRESVEVEGDREVRVFKRTRASR